MTMRFLILEIVEAARRDRDRFESRRGLHRLPGLAAEIEAATNHVQSRTEWAGIRRRLVEKRRLDG